MIGARPGRTVRPTLGRLAALVASFSIVIGPMVATASAQDDEGLLPLEVVGVETKSDGQVIVDIAAPADLTGTSLPASAFRIAQDGVDRPVSVQRLSDAELDVVLAIDISGSMEGPPMQAAKSAAVALLRQLPAEARVAVVAFGPTTQVAVPFTTDFQAVADAINALEPDGETALYDGVVQSVDQFALARTARRTIVLLGDGADTVSSATLEDAAARISDADVSLFAISLGQVELAPLEQLASAATSGQVNNATDSSVVALYDEIGRKLANQYRLIFTPSAAVGATGRVYVDQLGVRAVGSFEFDPAATNSNASSSESQAGSGPSSVTPVASFAPVEVSWAATDAARIGGLAALAAAIALIGLFLFNAAPSAVQLASDRARSASPSTSAANAMDRATGVAEQLLAHNDRGRLVGAALERAGMTLRPAEFSVMVFVTAVGLGALGFLFGGIIVAVATAALVVFAARLWVGAKGAKRSTAFTDQLGQTVQLMAGALRAGHALPQALEAVARESENPTGDEFHRLVTELRLGRDLDSSLMALAERVRSEDFEWVVRAIAIHREVGGDLAEVFDNIGGTIRDRGYIRRQFKALSAEGRYSAYLLVALPFLVIAALFATSPEYITLLFEDSRGKIVAAVAGVNLLIGSLWLKSMLRVRY